MCGICGIIGIADDESLRAMAASLRHRGPDDSGIFTSEEQRVSLGHTRLSILDLSPRGHQPMSDEQGRIWVTYNGEIYNFKSIRGDLQTQGYRFRSESDTEVLLYAYLEWGFECVHRLNGMFAFAIWDSRIRTLFAARDRLGIKPLYYSLSGTTLIFASEIKAILSSGLVRPDADLSALHTPSMYQVSPLTGFKGIQKLPPGCWLTFKDGNLAIHEYWNISPMETRIPEEEAGEELDHLLNTCVGEQMLSDVPVGALLSGGVDSSLVVALMARAGGGKIDTFTIKYAARDQKFERMPDDGKYARKVADLLGCDHHEIEIDPDVVALLPRMMWHLDEPLADPASINTYLIAKAARAAGITVLLNGMGGDEIFCGYRKHLACVLADYYQAYLPDFLRSMIRSVVDRLPAALSSRGLKTARWAKRFVKFASLPQPERFFVSSLTSPDDYRHLYTAGDQRNGDYWTSPCIAAQKPHLNREGLSYVTRMCLSDTLCFLPEHNLTYSDKCAMAAGVESRPPLTDHRLVEFMFGIQPELKLNGWTQKYLLKKVAERYLPREIVYRPKAPFGSPLRSWIRGPLAEMIGDYLAPESLKKRGVYEPAYVWQKIENDRRGVEDNAHLIWKLLCDEVWFRQFFG